MPPDQHTDPANSPKTVATARPMAAARRKLTVLAIAVLATKTLALAVVVTPLATAHWAVVRDRAVNSIRISTASAGQNCRSAVEYPPG